MSLKWPVKDPDETLDYSVDWSRFLESNTISTVRWYVVDADEVKTQIIQGQTVNGITSGPQVFTDTVATIVLSGGSNNQSYQVVCSITFGNDLIAERTLALPVREL